MVDETDLIQDPTHPVEENLEEVALEERHVQVTLLKRLWISPPVPPLADSTVVPELRRTIHLHLVSVLLVTHKNTDEQQHPKTCLSN